jgi:glycosyltransferase involved in cell wall biosynthesis
MKTDFLLICRQDGRKGINYLLHAAKILEQKGLDFQLAIAGGGRMLSPNLDLAKKLGLTKVKFLGFVKDTDRLLRTAKVFVFPSVEEGSSAISILEAMKAGLPIVSTDVDGISEDIENNKSGILVEAKNPEKLAAAMEKIMKNPEMAKKLGQEARKQYLIRHGEKNMTGQLKKLMKEII